MGGRTKLIRAPHHGWLTHVIPNIKRDVLDAGDGLGTGIGDSIVKMSESQIHAMSG